MGGGKKCLSIHLRQFLFVVAVETTLMTLFCANCIFFLSNSKLLNIANNCSYFRTLSLRLLTYFPLLNLAQQQ